MPFDIACPACGEDQDLAGVRSGDTILLTCERCGQQWERDPSPRCDRCGGADLQAVVQAIVEKGRGTQLSVVGTRVVHLCRRCDQERLERYNRNRPNPLMPDELPTVGPDERL